MINENETDPQNEFYGVSIGCAELVYCGTHETYEDAKDHVEDIFTPQGDVIECLMSLSDWRDIFLQFEERGIEFR